MIIAVVESWCGRIVGGGDDIEVVAHPIEVTENRGLQRISGADVLVDIERVAGIRHAAAEHKPHWSRRRPRRGESGTPENESTTERSCSYR